MTDTTVSDAVVFPQDEGTGVPDGAEDYTSGGFFGLLSKYKGDGSYIGEDTAGSATMQFSGVDTTNEEVDINPGYAYIMDSGVSVQAGAQNAYDTTLPEDIPYVVVLPSSVTNLGLGADTDNDLWLAVDNTAQDGVYIRHGSGLSAPSDPSVKLGTVNTSTGATTRPNDLASVSLRETTTEEASLGDGDKIILGDDGDFTVFYGPGSNTLHVEDSAGAKLLELTPSGELNIHQSNLQLRGNELKTVSNIRIADNSDKTAVISLVGDGSHALRITSPNVTGDFLEFKEGPTPQTEANNRFVIEEGANLLIGDGIDAAGGIDIDQRGTDPDTNELGDGRVMTYVSDGTTGVTGAAGDLVYAFNDAGTIKTQVIAAAANAT